jgi:hypothetical protein
LKLSILIPTLPERKESFSELMRELFMQIAESEAWNDVEVLYDDTKRGVITTGEKRNNLIGRAIGNYVWQVDDDDMVFPSAISNILTAIESEPDCLSINGIMTTDGGTERQWFIAIGNEYVADYSTGKEIYLRYPNHITPIKRSIANQFKFPSLNNFEDKAWADMVRNSGLLKTEVKIELPIYHYKYSTKNKSY